jgi:hypothetical protein
MAPNEAAAQSFQAKKSEMESATPSRDGPSTSVLVLAAIIVIAPGGSMSRVDVGGGKFFSLTKQYKFFFPN